MDVVFQARVLPADSIIWNDGPRTFTFRRGSIEVAFADSVIDGVYRAAAVRETLVFRAQSTICRDCSDDSREGYMAMQGMLDSLASSARFPIVRGAWLLNHLHVLTRVYNVGPSGESTDLLVVTRLRQILDTVVMEIPPTSQLWSMYAFTLNDAVNFSGQIMRYVPFMERIAREYPGSSVRRSLLSLLIASAESRKDKGRRQTYERWLREENAGRTVPYER
jgi:hypothetical protein